MDTISILEDIIKINSTNLPGNEKDMTAYIMKRFDGWEEMVEIDHGDNRASLVVDIKGKTDETVGFVGHIDTVPVSNPDDWKFPPFSAHVEDGLMYGRGSTDMKSGVACMISLGEYYMKNENKPNRNIRLIFTADEESNGLGVTTVLEKGYIDDLDFIIVPENTSSLVAIKEKGALWIELEVYGRSAHGARPDLGINSIDLTYEIYRDLKSYVSNYCDDEYLGDSTVSINCIDGGEKVNIIADYCKSQFDIRANPDLKNKDIKIYLDKVIKKYMHLYRGSNIKYKVITDRISFEADLEDSYVKEFINQLDKNKMDNKLTGITYFTDLSLTQIKEEKPFVVYGPGFIDKGHQTDESVSIDAVKEVSEFFINYFK